MVVVVLVVPRIGPVVAAVVATAEQSTQQAGS